MAQVSMNAYDADVFIPEFKGLMQYGDQMNGDLRYSPNCMNVETPGGVLQPVALQRGAYIKTPKRTASGNIILGHETGVLMHLRSKKIGMSSVTVQKGGYESFSILSGEFDTYLYAQGGYVYSMKVTGDMKESGWYSMPILIYDSAAESRIIEGKWDWTTYEHNDLLGSENMLLLTNPDVGMFSYVSSGTGLTKVTTPANFNCISRYAERIWGVAGDTIYYSKPYDSTDWTQDNNDPANGGGEIREPTFDKDKIVGMGPLGDALIIFSEKRAWRLTGSDPTNFNIQEQIGNGTKYPETIVNMGERIIMLGDDGLYQYDGYHVYPLMHEATHEIFRDIAYGQKSTPRAVKIGDKYVLALNNEIGTQPVWSYGVNESGVIENPVTRNTGHGYMTIVYDMTDGTITRMNGPKIISFCEDTPYFISHYEGEVPETISFLDTYEDSNHKTYNKLMHMRFDSWNEQMVSTEATKWVSPWVTFGRQDVKKGGFELYFTPEVRPKKVVTHELWVGAALVTPPNDYPTYYDTEEVSGSVTLKFTIQTEKKSKSKTYTVQPLTAAEIAAGKEHKMKRLHFGGSGRRFRVIIETEAGNTIPWRLIGGVHIIAEMDKD